MSARICGDCTLCCRLVPVETLGKAANTKCRHQSRRGCSIYEHLADLVPDCRLWSCQWLVDPEATELRRPDRVHYVIDIMPDFIGMQDAEQGTVKSMPVLQVWVDPDHPDAWERDAALRRYIEHVGATRGQATLVRLGSKRGIAIFPPPLTDDGGWHRRESSEAQPATEWRNPMEEIHRTAKAMRPAGGDHPAQAMARGMAHGGGRPIRLAIGQAPPAPESPLGGAKGAGSPAAPARAPEGA